jgi:hypothetical protein
MAGKIRQYNRFDVLLKAVHEELAETRQEINSLYITNEHKAILKRQVPELEKLVLYVEGKTEWCTEVIADMLNEEQENNLLTTKI